jgi:hypothetical protein
MKARILLSFSQCGHAGLRALLLLMPALVANAQNYSIDWFTINGGGGTSSAGAYAISGTLGQPDAGNLSGGNYRLEGGFWSIVAALQTPDAPRLSIGATGGVVILSWPQPAAGWTLYTTPTVPSDPVPWTLVSPPYQTNATHWLIQVPAPPGNRFYRLQKQ